MMAVLRHVFSHLDEKIFLPLYISLVRAHLDCSASVYWPVKVADIVFLELAQRRSTKVVPGFK